VSDKLKAIKMINEMGLNDKVGEIIVFLKDSNEWNDKILTWIISKYTSVYAINIFDINDEVDNKMHGFIKQFVN